MISRKVWNWLKDNEVRYYTISEVEDLLERIKLFNAGVIDQYLNQHVDKVFEEWKENTL